MIRISDHVFAAANSATRYGIGLVFAFLAKKQMNVANVNITISLDVNIVSIAIRIYKVVNNAY